MAGDFSIPYDVNEATLSVNTIYWFYIPPSYDLTQPIHQYRIIRIMPIPMRNTS